MNLAVLLSRNLDWVAKKTPQVRRSCHGRFWRRISWVMSGKCSRISPRKAVFSSVWESAVIKEIPAVLITIYLNWNISPTGIQYSNFIAYPIQYCNYLFGFWSIEMPMKYCSLLDKQANHNNKRYGNQFFLCSLSVKLKKDPRQFSCHSL